MRVILTFCLIKCLLLAKFAAGNEFPNEIAEQFSRCLAHEREPWSYTGENGPDHWWERYPECHGMSQSPIYIDSSRVLADRNLNKMYFFYFTPLTRPTIRNDGHTIVVTPGDTFWRAIYINRCFYLLKSIHFHWGSVTEQGSEHIVDGVQYPMEMHLVHENSNNETAVVAIFFEEVDHINAELQHIVNEFPKVMYKDTEIVSPYRLDMKNLLPENPASFYRYDGSLTTPECTEGVIWSVVKTPIHVAHSQMREFRKLFSSPQNVTENGCRISDNFRPVQHLRRRRVYTSL